MDNGGESSECREHLVAEFVFVCVTSGKHSILIFGPIVAATIALSTHFSFIYDQEEVETCKDLTSGILVGQDEENRVKVTSVPVLLENPLVGITSL